MNKATMIFSFLFVMLSIIPSSANDDLLEKKVINDFVFYYYWQGTIMHANVIQEESCYDPRLIDYFKNKYPEEDISLLRSYTKNNQEKIKWNTDYFQPSSIDIISKAEIKNIVDNDKWSEFYKLYPNSQGILKLSRVGFNSNKDKALLYAIYHPRRGGIGGGYGAFIILKRERDFWRVIDRYIAPNKATEYSSDPQAIIDEVASRGDRMVLRELNIDHDVWSSVLRRIATGDELWLKAAVALRPGADAIWSYDLDSTIGEALEHAPEQVLRIASPSFGLRFICGGPDVDDTRYDSYELSIQAIERRKKRVAEISDPDLKSDRDKCIDYLEASKTGIARYYGVDTQ